MFDDQLKPPVGRFRLWVWERGVLVDAMDEPNLIVTASKQVHAQLLGGDVINQSVTRIGYGSGTNVPDPGNSALTAPFMKALDGHNYPASNLVNFNFSLLTTEANGLNVAEFGLFTASGTLYARKVRSVPIPKTSAISFTGTWTISF